VPLFEYRCKKCGEVTEFLENTGAPGPHPCGKCGSPSTHKAFSPFSARVVAPAPACADGACKPSAVCRRGMCPVA
jgi:putative FmdB family regulatory protein